MRAMRGLYLHVPFCHQKCFYCDFVITLQLSQDARKRFFEALKKEIGRAAARYGKLIFSTLYIGGGTPSLLSADEMTRLTTEVREHFDFEPGFEFTCEMNPGDADLAKLRAFREIGVNRVSLGAQAFQERLLKEMGRHHGVREIADAVQMIRNAGIENISLDLISGLPHQSLQDFHESLKKTVELQPSQVSLYDLEIRDRTPWGILHQKGELNPAGEDLRAEMFQTAIDVLTDAGYVQYEISTFSKPGFESRHNLIYWNNQEYLGLGPGAFSYMKGERSQFSFEVPQYLEKCEAEKWEPEVKDRLNEEEKETETLVTGLRLTHGVDLESFRKIRPKIESRLAELEEGNLVTRAGSRIALTPRGRFLAERTFSLLIGK
jgi:oxygen-independent coproporphyrinogen III oxidase